MKQQIEDLISRLASKELTFGCLLENKHQIDGNPYKIKQFICKTFVGQEEYKCREFDNKITHFTPAALIVLGHPILKCHIENKLWKNKGEQISFDEVQMRLKSLNYLWWQSCGDFTRSLQSIVDEAEWEWITYGAKAGHETTRIQVPKQKHIKNLFQFLLTLSL